MREGTASLKVANVQCPSTTSGSKTKASKTSENDGSTTTHAKGKKTTSRKVRFTSPPKYKTKRSLKSAVSSRSGKPRAALKTLQPHASSNKILVGAGSPRIASIGKTEQGLKQTQLPFSPPVRPLTFTDTTTVAEEDCGESCVVPMRRPGEEQRIRGEGTVSSTKGDPTTSVDYRMVTEETPPTEYWQVLAEQRRLALVDTLQENKELHTEIARLKARVEELEHQVEDKNYFAMMYKLVSEDKP